MKSKKGESDLEQQVDLLKRIIEKQRAQLDVLEKENAKIHAIQQKKENKKNVRADEAQLNSDTQYEINKLQKIMKDLTGANEELREQLKREHDRYKVLEARYSECIYKLSNVTMENQKNQELAFGLSTGTNFNKYQGYLGDDRD